MHDSIPYDRIRPIEWTEQGIRLIDQRRLPAELSHLLVQTLDEAVNAIRDMVVRGAPAIGITAAYATVLSIRTHYSQSPSDWQQRVDLDLGRLLTARPTAVNLHWAVDYMRHVLSEVSGDPEAEALLAAKMVHTDDIEANRRMGQLGADLISRDSAVLTHCNAGALATGGYGTALGVVRAGFTGGQVAEVYADETRPWLQGARLTAWELQQEGIPVTLLADSAAAYLMKQGGVQWVIVGSDRIAANGDVANKIGTYSLALAARQHGVKFMVAAPTSTIDMETHSGVDIPIEIRSEEEVLTIQGQALSPPGVPAWNPAFDVTPAELVDVLVTERGVIERPDRGKIANLMQQ